MTCHKTNILKMRLCLSNSLQNCVKFSRPPADLERKGVVYSGSRRDHPTEVVTERAAKHSGEFPASGLLCLSGTATSQNTSVCMSPPPKTYCRHRS